MTPGLRALKENRKSTRNRRKKRHPMLGILPDDIHYTSLKARRACIELGIPFQVTHPTKSHKVRQDEVPRNLIVTSYDRELRHKSKRKSASSAALFCIGSSKGDFVTDFDVRHTSSLTSYQVIPPIRGRNITKQMGKQEAKGILQQTKPVVRSKRVTFNDDVIMNEFKPNSAIIPTIASKSPKKNDVTKDRIDDDTENPQRNEKERDKSETNDTRSDGHDQRNNGHPKKDYDERGDISTSEETESSENPRPALNEPTSAVDLIPCKRAVESEKLAAVDVEVGVATESELSQTEVTESKEEQIPAEEVAIPEIPATNCDTETSANADIMNSKTEKGGKNQDHRKSTKNPQKNQKKRLSANNINLPLIREELLSRMSDVTINDHDVEAVTSNNTETTAVSKKETDESLLTPLTKDDVIQRARADARLSALRGQIAADKAAWSCVVRYPRDTSSQPGSGRASPLTHEVIQAAARSPISCIEKRNPFPLSNSPPLTLYKPNFGPRNNRTLRRTLPPLTTPPRISQSGLVTQKNCGMWVPDVSLVCKSGRRRITVKGSNVTIREIRR